METAHATLLLDLQVIQRALGQGGHRGVLCWRPDQQTPFVLRLASVTLSLRHDLHAPLQDRLGLLSADGRLRPVTPDELGFYAQEFMPQASPDLVPLLTSGTVSETLRGICTENAACTAQLAVNRAAVQKERRRFIMALVGLAACVPALIWGEKLTAAFATGLDLTLMTYLGDEFRKARDAERATRQVQAELQDEVLLALGQVPTRAGEKHDETGSLWNEQEAR